MVLVETVAGGGCDVVLLVVLVVPLVVAAVAGGCIDGPLDTVAEADSCDPATVPLK